MMAIINLASHILASALILLRPRSPCSAAGCPSEVGNMGLTQLLKNVCIEKPASESNRDKIEASWATRQQFRSKIVSNFLDCLANP
jgi:hypothetical protein